MKRFLAAGLALLLLAAPGWLRAQDRSADALLDEMDREIGAAPAKSGQEPAAPTQAATPPGDSLLDELDKELGPPTAAKKPAADDNLLDELDQELGLPAQAAPKPTGADDLLDDLDQELGGKPAPAKPEAPAAKPAENTPTLLSGLARNLDGELTVSLQHFWEKVSDEDNDLDRNPDLLDAWLELDTFASGKGWRIDLGAWLQGGNQEELYAGAMDSKGGDDRRRHATLDEAYATLSRGDLDLTLGKKVATYGLSTLYAPTNRYGAADANDPLNPREFGVWQAKADYYLGQATLSWTVFPAPERNRLPVKSSRWNSSGEDYEFRNLEGLGGLGANSTLPDELAGVEVVDEKPKAEPRNVGNLGQVKGTISGWDLFALGYYGLNPFPVLKKSGEGPQTTYTKVRTHVANLGAGFSTTRGKWEYHGEALYNYAMDRRDDEYTNYVGGVTYTVDDLAKRVGLDRIVVTAEYAGEWLTAPQRCDSYIASSENARVGRNDALVRAEFKYDEDLDFELDFNREFSQEGQFERYAVNYTLRKAVKLHLYFDHFSGSDESYYGRWERNNRMATELSYSF